MTLAAPRSQRARLVARSDAGAPIRFSEGLVGFPEPREYRLIESTTTGLYWLQGGTPSAPSFMLCDPFVYFEGYSFDLTPEQANRIGVDEPSQVGVLTISVPDTDTGVWTANLQGPVVLNVQQALGAQMVLSDHSLGVRRPFRPLALVPNGAAVPSA